MSEAPSEVRNSTETQQEMLMLAKSAASNEGLEEIPPRVFQFGWMSGFGFTDYSTMSAEREFDQIDQPADLKTLDPSDSDGLGGTQLIPDISPVLLLKIKISVLEGPLLGRGSRLKRAKSAKSKTTEPSTPPSDERLLIQEDSSSTHSEDLGLMNLGFASGNGDTNGQIKTKSPRTNGKKRGSNGKIDRKAIRQRPRPKTAHNRY